MKAMGFLCFLGIFIALEFGMVLYFIQLIQIIRDKSSIQYRPVAQTVNPDLFQTNIPVCESNAMAFRHECRW